MFNVQRAALAAIGATLAAVSIAACDPGQTGSSTSTTAADLGSPAEFAAPTSVMPIAPTTQAAPDPLTSDGTWTVPGDLAVGTYRVTPHGITGGGYYEICADLTCEIGTPGFIRNDYLTGPGFLVIPPNAVAVKVQDLTLTRIAG